MMKLWSDVVNALAGKTLVTAESCTGGGIGSALTSVPGSSAVYKGGVICYTNWVKEHILGVDPKVLGQLGAVSAPVALAMARGVRERLRTDLSVSVTGYAGPMGGDEKNPVGTVFVCISSGSGESVTRLSFEEGMSREQIRKYAVYFMLTELQDARNL